MPAIVVSHDEDYAKLCRVSRRGIVSPILPANSLCSVNALNYYSPMIFKSIGFSGTSTSLLATGVYGVVKTIFTLIFITWFVDTWGRRPALLVGGAISFLAMVYLGTYSCISHSFDKTAPLDAGAYFAITFIYVYAASYSFSWNAIVRPIPHFLTLSPN